MIDAIKLSALFIKKHGYVDGQPYELRYERMVPIAGVWVPLGTPGTAELPTHSSVLEMWRHTYILHGRFMIRIAVVGSPVLLNQAFDFYKDTETLTVTDYEDIRCKVALITPQMESVLPPR